MRHDSINFVNRTIFSKKVYRLRKKVARSTFRKSFSYRAEFRSESETGEYLAAVSKILSSDRKFQKFKRDNVYSDILEHVTKDQGGKYLSILKSREDDVLKSFVDKLLDLDNVGNPIKYYYPDIDNVLSPTTLRYLKVASDLTGLFGHQIDNVAEIGCGYGGQCLINDKLLNIKKATLFDLPIVNELISRYLEANILDGCYRVSTLNTHALEDYNLCFSNYAFSELPKVLQLKYVEKVLLRSDAGYLTMNSGIGGDLDHNKLTLRELGAILPSFELYQEKPNTYKYNYIIVWGHNRDWATKNLLKFTY